ARTRPGPFSDRHVALLQAFADQAVIAMENARLFSELQERLEEQTATAEILRVISSSPGEVTPVLETIGEGGRRLCEAEIGVMARFDGEEFRPDVLRGANDELLAQLRGMARQHPLRLSRTTVTGRVGLERRTVHIPDVLDDPEYDWAAAQQL